MERAELQGRIQRGHQYLQKTDLTEEQRENAEVRLANYYAMLGEMEREEEVVPTAESIELPIDPRVLEHMNRIRSTLGMPPRTG